LIVSRKLLWWLSLAVLALALVLIVVAPEHPNVRRPILALELARTWPELSILMAVDRTMYWWNTRIDFAFIAAYAALFAALALAQARGHWRWAIAGLALAAGVSDVNENFAILRVLPLSNFDSEMALAIRQWSLTKWALLGGTWVALGVAFGLGSRRAIVPGALYVAAGVLTLWGTFDDRWIQFGAGLLALPVAWQLHEFWPWNSGGGDAK
jgi:hypothetical protein